MTAAADIRRRRSLTALAAVGRTVKLPLLLFVVIVVAWYAVKWALALPSYLMPTPRQAADALLREHAMILHDVGYTIAEAVTGLVLATALALATAGASVTMPAFGRAVLPFAVALRSTPVVAIAPLVTLLVGRGFWTGASVATIAAFFPIMVNGVRGFGSMSAQHGELMHLLAASRWQVFRYVRLPFALPHVFAGLRTAAPVAVLGAMLAEWLTGVRGVGYLMLDAAAMRDQDLLWAGICVSMVLALIVFWSTLRLEQWFLRKNS